jgi:tetrathionate reductase subunit C
MHIIELLTPAYEAAWLPWAVQYFFLIGIAATTALLAAWLAFGGPESERARLLPAVVTVLVVASIAAPVSLLADLHQPGRFWHFYAHPTPWSWMSLGSVLLPLFVLLSLGFAALWWLRQTGWMRATAVLLALSAISILTYTGGELMVVRARPLWATLFLPFNLALTGALGALGAVLLVARWLPQGLEGLPVLLVRRLAQGVTLALVLVALGWALLGARGQSPSFTEAVQLFNDFGAWKLALIGSVLGGLVLLALVWRPWREPACALQTLVLALAMLVAAWVFRWIVFMAVQTVPKFGAGLYLQGISWGSDGVLGMVGVFGLVAALLAVATYALDRYPRRPLSRTA